MDDGWKVVEVEPETISVNGNGHHANGGDAIGIGPTVELVPSQRAHQRKRERPRARIPVNGNGHHEDESDGGAAVAVLLGGVHGGGAGEAEAQGRQDRRPATLSMFEWAMTLEEQREEEPVGAGR